MKRNAIIRIITWSIALLALSGILIALMADELYLRDYTPAETIIPVPLATQPEEVTPVQALPNEGSLQLNPNTVREIEINWAAGDILILTRDIEEIKISESDLPDASSAMVWQVQGTELTIDFCEDTLIGIHADSLPAKDLYVEVPADWTCDAIEINAASATLEVRNLTIREVDLDGADGTCSFRNCHITDLDIDTASGDVYFDGTLDALDFDAVSASFIGELQNTPSRIDMDGMSGKLDIALPEDCGFTLTMDGMSSHFTSDFYGTAMKNGSHVYGDGRCRINVDGMSCNAAIRKLDTVYTDEPETATAATEATLDPTTEATVPCTGPNCGDPSCPAHHGSADCSDPDCPRHHPAP